jgi:hypothetical protein
MDAIAKSGNEVHESAAAGKPTGTRPDSGSLGQSHENSLNRNKSQAICQNLRQIKLLLSFLGNWYKTLENHGQILIQCAIWREIVLLQGIAKSRAKYSARIQSILSNPLPAITGASLRSLKAWATPKG